MVMNLTLYAMQPLLYSDRDAPPIPPVFVSFEVAE